MTFFKPFSLKLFYFAVGALPVLVLAIVSQQDLDKSPANFLWFGLFGFTLMATFLIQNKLRKMGVISFKEIGTYIALFLMATAFLLIIRQIL